MARPNPRARRSVRGLSHRTVADFRDVAQLLYATLSRSILQNPNDIIIHIQHRVVLETPSKLSRIMTGSHIPTPNKIPQIPKRNPARQAPSSLPFRKRQADPLSLRHDPRTTDISSKDNDRKRSGRVTFGEDKDLGIGGEIERQDNGSVQDEPL